MGRGVWHRYIAATTACLSVVTSACCYGWFTPILPRLLSSSTMMSHPWELTLSTDQLPWVASVTELGVLFSSLPAALLSSCVGRKMMLLSSAPLIVLSWTVVLGFPSALGLAVARFVQGMSIGIVSTVVPEYLSEIGCAGPLMSRLCGGAWWLGILLGYVVGPHTDLYSPLTIICVPLALNIAFCLTFVWQPDTPVFHLLWGDEERATRALLWLRDGTADAVKREVDEIKVNLDVNRKATSFRDLTATSADRQGLALVLALAAVRGLGGHSVLIVFASHIFSRLGPSHATDTLTAALGLVMLLSHWVGVWLCDRVGRRPLLLFSCLGSLVCHLVVGTYFLLLSLASVDGLGWCPVLAVLVFSGVHCACVAPVAAAYSAELFRAPVKDFAAMLSSLLTTLLVFGSLSVYSPMVQDIGMCANFYLYAIANMIGCVYFYLFAPETKGKSVFQIRKELCGVPISVSPPEMEPLFSEIDDDIESL